MQCDESAALVLPLPHHCGGSEGQSPLALHLRPLHWLKILLCPARIDLPKAVINTGFGASIGPPIRPKSVSSTRVRNPLAAKLHDCKLVLTFPRTPCVCKLSAEPDGAARLA